MESDGRPSFNLLQYSRSSVSHIILYAFDLLMLEGRDLTGEPLAERRRLLELLPKPSAHVGLSQISDLPLADITKWHGGRDAQGLFRLAKGEVQWSNR